MAAWGIEHASSCAADAAMSPSQCCLVIGGAVMSGYRYPYVYALFILYQAVYLFVSL